MSQDKGEPSSGRRFAPLDHPSDIGIIVYGNSRQEIFENAAFGLFSLMVDLDKVRPEQKIEIRIEAEDDPALLVNWLNELIYLEDAKKMLFSKFNIKEFGPGHLAAEVWGEMFDGKRHNLARPIKAATYNQLQIGPREAKIVFDV